MPIDDPVDRRNAPMLQIVLLLLGSLPPLAWAYRLITGIPWRPGETLSLCLSLALSALAIFSFVLIRRGRLQWAVRQLMAVVALVVMLSYLGNGFDANRFEHPVQVMWLVIAGLMIGRRALWLMYAWTVLAFAVGVWRDVGAKVPAASSVANFGVDAAISATIFLFVAIVVDRSMSALRESLDAANRRGSELAEANRRLQDEIAERERVQSQLIHAQKVEAVGRLASGVAHDFNHLLGLILGYAERGQRSSDSAEAQKALSGVESAARRASAISQKLLNFSRQDLARAETFDACAALLDMRMPLRQLFDPAVEIDFDLPERPVPIHFDRVHFELMVLNIAANADHAMPDGGSFTIALRHAEEEGALVALDLSDTGHGMGEDVRARVFEPFFTTKPSGQGTGLGLAVVRDLVVNAEGRIEVESRVGEGTVFRIRLPQRAEAA
ncbi:MULTISPECIES: ATP-binding protein [unclassified Lysobacter]|uniref:sensor histidine kinase n=2 Tax=Lysobacter TaxID=68 RepID=UPI00307CD830